MAYNPNEFVNREAQIQAFARFLRTGSQRILLLQGPPGIGKTALSRRLRSECRGAAMRSVRVDFRNRPELSEPEGVIDELRERIGGIFADRMEAEAAGTYRDLGAAPTTQALLGAIASGGGAGGDVSLQGEFDIQGDVVGRNKVTIVNSFNGFGGVDWRREAETRRNRAFREALKQLLADQNLILFFDHLEEASQVVARWIRNKVLDLSLEDDVDEFPNLWLVVAGRRVPLLDEVDEWPHKVRLESVGPLSEKAICEFWVEKRQLDPAQCVWVAAKSQGNPTLLVGEAFLAGNGHANGDND